MVLLKIVNFYIGFPKNLVNLMIASCYIANRITFRIAINSL